MVSSAVHVGELSSGGHAKSGAVSAGVVQGEKILDNVETGAQPAAPAPIEQGRGKGGGAALAVSFGPKIVVDDEYRVLAETLEDKEQDLGSLSEGSAASKKLAADRAASSPSVQPEAAVRQESRQVDDTTARLLKVEVERRVVSDLDIKALAARRQQSAGSWDSPGFNTGKTAKIDLDGLTLRPKQVTDQQGRSRLVHPSPFSLSEDLETAPQKRLAAVSGKQQQPAVPPPPPPPQKGTDHFEVTGRKKETAGVVPPPPPEDDAAKAATPPPPPPEKKDAKTSAPSEPPSPEVGVPGKSAEASVSGGVISGKVEPARGGLPPQKEAPKESKASAEPKVVVEPKVLVAPEVAPEKGHPAADDTVSGSGSSDGEAASVQAGSAHDQPGPPTGGAHKSGGRRKNPTGGFSALEKAFFDQEFEEEPDQDTFDDLFDADMDRSPSLWNWIRGKPASAAGAKGVKSPSNGGKQRTVRKSTVKKPKTGQGSKQKGKSKSKAAKSSSRARSKSDG